jgi:hypothetical protein
MFDRIYVKCPYCGGEAEFQSKAGECILANYYVPGNIPTEIAADLQDTSEYCSECSNIVTIRIKQLEPPPGMLPMDIV